MQFQSKRLVLGYLGLAFCFQSTLSKAQTESTLDTQAFPMAAPVSPKESIHSFELLDGFRMELLAAEPLVTDPVAMQYDENGLAYVVEMNDYPYTDTSLDVAWKEQTSAAIGKVRVLEDTDGDGRFDKSTVFAEGLSWPTGLACWKGGVFVTATPDVWYLKDTNGDNRADVRRKVLTGFRKFNVQAVMNNLAWGLDHRIYAAGASNGGDIRMPSNDEGKPTRLGRNDFRIDPVTESFEILSGGARFGNTFDNFGNRFICNIRNPVQHIVLQQRYLARNPQLPVSQAVNDAALASDAIEVFRASPPEPWRVENAARLSNDASRKSPRSEMAATGYVTSSSGITVYRGAAYPEEYYGNVFVCEVAGNLVLRYALREDGPTFVAERTTVGKEFLASTDNWCRPVNFVNAPDGTLHVLDMYRETIEHPWSIPDDIKARLDLQSGRDRGRIFRLAPREYPAGYQVNRQPRLETATIHELVAELENPNCWWRETAHRLIFERQDQAATEALHALLASSKSSLARLHALWSLEGLGSLTEGDLFAALADRSPGVKEHAVRLAESRLNDSETLYETVLALAEDENERVRFQVALSLGEYQGLAIDEKIAALAKIMITDGGNRWTRIAVLSSIAGLETSLVERLIGDDDYVTSDTGPAVVTTLAEVIGTRNKPVEVNRLLTTLEEVKSMGSLAHESVIALGKGLRQSQESLDRYATEDSSLVAKLFAKAEAAVANTDTDASVRIRMTELLTFKPFSRVEPLLLQLLNTREPQALQLAAVDAIGSFSDKRVARILLEAYPRLTPGVRSQIISALLARAERVLPLCDAIETGFVARSSVTTFERDLLSKNRNEEIRNRAEAIFASDSLSSRAKVIEEYQQALALSGESERGEKIFQRECLACHRLGNQGHDAGVNLATVKNRTKGEILVHLLDPNREVSPNYSVYIVLTADGRTHTGVIAAETATSVTLRQGEGKQETILRSNIDQISSSGLSLMPEGLEKKISVTEMADLLSFVLKMAPK